MAVCFQVVGSKDGLGLSVAITLGMALTIAVAQPFARPQQNALYGFCFACDLSCEWGKSGEPAVRFKKLVCQMMLWIKGKVRVLKNHSERRGNNSSSSVSKVSPTKSRVSGYSVGRHEAKGKNHLPPKRLQVWLWQQWDSINFAGGCPSWRCCSLCCCWWFPLRGRTPKKHWRLGSMRSGVY